MKWLIVALLALALLLAGFAVNKANQVESAAKPRIQLIAAR